MCDELVAGTEIRLSLLSVLIIKVCSKYISDTSYIEDDINNL